MSTENKKMKVEIWSDVMCPFCYIGKRRFEAALSEFQHKKDIEIIWKSFQLNPNMVTNTKVSVIENLAKSKGWTLEYTREMGSYVTNLAAGVGLMFNYDKAVVANSFNAHRLLQFAKSKGKGDMLKENLLKAYFTDGKNTDDSEVLMELGESVGLQREEVLSVVLDKNAYVAEVQNDVQESKELGINGVPYYVFDGKYGISGAQEIATFVQSLERAHSEWKTSNPTFSFDSIVGPSCTSEGDYC